MSPEEFAEKLGRPKRNGRDWTCLCPAHDDHDPSLSIAERDGRLLFVCRAGCSQDNVIDALRSRGLWPPEVSAKKEIVATYNYRDEHGSLRYQVVRYAPKDFRQRRPNGAPDEFVWNMHGVEPLPYRLPELLADPDGTVFICEGEKDCDRLGELGFVTSCNHGGASKWRSEISCWFQDRDVVLLPDNDDPGRSHMADVAAKLAGIAKTIRTVTLPGLPDKGDVANWIADGGTAEELDALVADPKQDWRAWYAKDTKDIKHSEPPAPPWILSRLADWVGRIVEPRVFVMEDWLPLGEYVSLYGIAGARKTDFIIQALMASSAGLPFCGFPMGHYVTLGLFCEDSEEELVRRIDRIAAFYELTRADFTGFFWASLVGCDQTEFIHFDFGRMLPQDAFRLFEQQIAELGAGLAALDTIADFFGGEEISRRQVSQFLRMLNGCCFRHKCTIIGSRHPSRSGRNSGTFESGSTGWEGKERARLHLRDPAQDQDDAPAHQQHSNKRVLIRAKSNYAMPGEEIQLVFEDGGFKRFGGDVPRGHIRDLAADAKFLELLRSCNKLGRHIHDAASHPGQYAPKVFASHPERADFSQAEFKRAMDRLFAAGRISLKRDRSGKYFEENQ
jgi:RecA-family ATPase